MPQVIDSFYIIQISISISLLLQSANYLTYIPGALPQAGNRFPLQGKICFFVPAWRTKCISSLQMIDTQKKYIQSVRVEVLSTRQRCITYNYHRQKIYSRGTIEHHPLQSFVKQRNTYVSSTPAVCGLKAKRFISLGQRPRNAQPKKSAL